VKQEVELSSGGAVAKFQQKRLEYSADTLADQD
jgi:hypothetical protein